MKYFILDQEEQELLRAYESGKLKSVPNLKKQIKYYQNLAKSSLKKESKNRNVNLRISDVVLFKLKEKAIQEGLPYQTLASSILHKYAMS